MKTKGALGVLQPYFYAIPLMFLAFTASASTFGEAGATIPLNAEEIKQLKVEEPAWAAELEGTNAPVHRPSIALGDSRYPLADDGPQNSGFNGTKWPNGVVYYQFDANVNATNRQRFRDAAAEWSAVAGLTFIEGTGSGNYIHVQDDTGNYSYVGMIGGAQTLGMYNWTWRYIICHEIAHAMGQVHEQSRSDRDTYVIIYFGNIESGKEHNFDKETTTNYGPYDFESVMHYGKTAFSKNGFNTIEPTGPYSGYLNTIGQRTYLSMSDKNGMAARYPRTPPTPTGFKVTSNSWNSVKLNWNASFGATRYEVWRKTGSGAYVKIAYTTAPAFTDSSAASGRDYKYKIVALNAHGAGPSTVAKVGKRWGRADLLVRRDGSPIIGNNRYNTYSGQTVRSASRRWGTTFFSFFVQNDSKSGKEVFRSSGRRGTAYLDVQYYSAAHGGNVTSKMAVGNLKNNVWAKTKQKVQVRIRPTVRGRTRLASITVNLNTKFLSFTPAKDLGRIQFTKLR